MSNVYLIFDMQYMNTMLCDGRVNEIPVESNLLFSEGTSFVSTRKTFDRTDKQANSNIKNSGFISENT